MKRLFQWVVLLCILSIFQLSCSVFQKDKKTNSSLVSHASPIQDTTGKKNTDSSKISKPQPYKEVITDKAITDDGLFKVHQVDQRYYFEIPDSLLGRDILTVNRIAKGAANVRPVEEFYGYAGDEIGENVIQFSKGVNNKLFIRRMSFHDRSADSSDNGMYRSVVNSNFQPIVAGFDIKALSPDSSGVVIDVTDYMNGDNDVLFFNAKSKRLYGANGIQADKSYIASIHSFPMNVEIRTVKTFLNGADLISYELNSSIVLLPKAPMQARTYDPRVGYFNEGYWNFDDPEGVSPKFVITRWRLEPKPEDVEKYKRGELVEPQKPIVYYIDPATPKKWVPYLIQGVNDWQKAFEKAGFNKAIYAVEARPSDSTWRLEDASHNAIIYKPSVVPNAYGPEVHDPRTGEIMESHVSWFHNIQSILHDWYMIQGGPNDPRARKMQFSDSLMGQLIRYVCCHEVGHTLGLRHNFGASATVPTDSLRSRTYVAVNGFCPSTMDYARFNYVAQPEDGMTEKELMPRLGIYDEWAIEWGYKWLPQLKTDEQEKAYMNQWIISKISKDKRLLFGSETGWLWHDPNNNLEDLGDDAIKAAHYGMKNLKLVCEHLPEWTKEPNEGYQGLQKMYGNVLQHYYNYLQQAITHLGGINVYKKTVEQKGNQYEFVSREKQKEAMQFLQDELFSTPQWLMNKRTFDLIGGEGGSGMPGEGGMNILLTFQKRFLAEATSGLVFRNLLLFQDYKPGNAYTVNELFDDLESGIWKELKMRKPIDHYRRSLERIYVKRLITMLSINGHSNLDVGADNWLFSRNYEDKDIIPIVKGRMRNLVREIDAALPTYRDEITRLHLVDIRDQLKDALKPGAKPPIESTTGQNKNAFKFQTFYSKDLNNGFPVLNQYRNKGCWDNGLENWYDYFFDVITNNEKN